MKEVYFDVGLDPNHRIAENAETAGEDRRMARLFLFKTHYGIPGEFDAAFVPAKEPVQNKNEGMLLGASILRDCYGKVNFLFAPLHSPFLNGIAKVLKAYRKDICVIAVTEAQPDNLTDISDIDKIVTVSCADTADVAAKAKELEHYSPDSDSAAVLLAAKNHALSAKDKHARYVLLMNE